MSDSGPTIVEASTEPFQIVRGGLSSECISDVRDLSLRARQLTEQAVSAGVGFEEHASIWLKADTWGLEPAFRAGSSREFAMGAPSKALAESGLYQAARSRVGATGFFSLAFSVLEATRR